MPSRRRQEFALAWIGIAALLAGVVLVLALSPPRADAWLALLVVLALALAGALTALYRSRCRTWDRILDEHVPGSGHESDGDRVARLASDSAAAVEGLRAHEADLDWLAGALTAVLEGRDVDGWPDTERLNAVVTAVRSFLADRGEDAAAASELLGLWIERLEGMQARLSAHIRKNGLGERVAGTDGGKLSEPTDSLGALFSHSLQTALDELAGLEASARTLRRRLGGVAASELTEDDFVT